MFSCHSTDSVIQSSIFKFFFRDWSSTNYTRQSTHMFQMVSDFYQNWKVKQKSNSAKPKVHKCKMMLCQSTIFIQTYKWIDSISLSQLGLFCWDNLSLFYLRRYLTSFYLFVILRWGIHRAIEIDLKRGLFLDVMSPVSIHFSVTFLKILVRCVVFRSNFIYNPVIIFHKNLE